MSSRRKKLKGNQGASKRRTADVGMLAVALQ
jgi:hypothetical protein